MCHQPQRVTHHRRSWNESCSLYWLAAVLVLFAFDATCLGIASYCNNSLLCGEKDILWSGIYVAGGGCCFVAGVVGAIILLATALGGLGVLAKVALDDGPGPLV